MRALWLAIALSLVPVLAAAQAADPLILTRPGMNPSGVGALPMMVIAESELQPDRYEHAPFPLKPWEEALQCLADQGVVGYIGDANQSPPEMLIVPIARTIRVYDMTLDSLYYAKDTTHVGSTLTAPTIAYTLVRSGVVLVTARYRENVPLLRHEALHMLIWWNLKEYGHPDWAFWPCDKGYEEK